jgi:hypothetical protein
MKFCRISSIFIALTGLIVVHALLAFQAADTTKTAVKKPKKAAQDTTMGTAATTTEPAKPATAKAKRAKVPETVDANQAVSTTTNRGRKATAKGTNAVAGTASRAASSGASTAKMSTPTKIVSDSEIAAAKSRGEVWVNTESGVYHKGGQWYGATREGKFMSEQDARKAGYHAAKTK